MLVLREKTNRKGEVTRFDVVRACNGTDAPEPADVQGLRPGSYKALAGDIVFDVAVEYETVQLQHTRIGGGPAETTQVG